MAWELHKVITEADVVQVYIAQSFPYLAWIPHTLDLK